MSILSRTPIGYQFLMWGVEKNSDWFVKVGGSVGVGGVEKWLNK